jgi:hypothetical protein
LLIDDRVLQAEQLHQRAMALGLRQQLRNTIDERHTRCVDQDNRCMCGRCARHHVARVLLVARRVGDDELALSRCKVTVGDVDRDALLTFGFEAVGQQRQIDFVANGTLIFRARQCGELVAQHRFAVVQQAADQRALAIVDATRGNETQHAEVFWLVNTAHDCFTLVRVLRNNLASYAVPSRLRRPDRPSASRRVP